MTSLNIPNIVMRSVFKYKSAGLNICLINAGSVFPKVDQFRRIFETSTAHLVIVPETWFKSYRSNASIALEGYDILRNDRIARRSGGVAVYIRKGIKTKVIKSSVGLRSEYMFFEVIFPNYKILFGAYYKAPDVDEIDEFDAVVAELSPSYADVIVLGDFNENLLRINSAGVCSKCVNDTCRVCRFSHSLVKYGLKSIGTAPTHFEGQPSLIDLVLSNRPSNFKVFSQIESGLSNHDIVFATFIGPEIDTDKRKSARRDYKSINMHNLVHGINTSSLNDIFVCTDVNSMVKIFNEVVVRLLNEHAPIIAYKPTTGINSTQPWYSYEIDKATIDRDLAKKNLKENITVANRRLYNALRNRVTQMVRNAKDAFLKPRLNVNIGMKNLWRNAKSLGLASSQSHTPTPAFTAHDFNLHTAGITNVATSASQPAITPLQSCHNVCQTARVSIDPAEAKFSFRNVYEDEIYRAMMSIKSDAVGLDSIPLRFTKLIFPYVLQHIKHIMNFTITSSKVTDDWKVSRVLPVHKKTRFFNLSDFRAIHILPVISKMFEIILAQQIEEFLKQRSLMSHIQSGFRPAHSTTTALLKITNDISRALDKKLVAILLLLDFSKAFDSVNHRLLCLKLESQFHFDDTATNLISSYLVNRKQAVDIDGTLSSFVTLTKGIPQGSVLGPILFCLFINDLPKSLKYMFSHLYADDAQLYKFFSSEDVNSAINQVNADLQAVCKWASDNGLELNADKSQAMVIGDKNLGDYPPIYMYGVDIEQSKLVKNLGLIMNNKFSWEDHAAKISQRIFIGLRSLWPLSNSTPVRTRLLLAKSLLLPHLDYCSEVFYYGLDSSTMKVLEKSVKSIARYVYGLKWNDSTESYIVRLLGSSLDTFLKVRCMCFLYKLDRSGQPAYLKNLLRLGQSSRSMQFIIPRFQLAVGSKTLFGQGLMDWNLIPVKVRMVNSVSVFRKNCTELFHRRNNPTIYE